MVPLNGRKLGRSTRVGHDVHFICNAGFQLVGSESRTCRRDRTWSGTQPFCRSEVPWAWGRGIAQGVILHPLQQDCIPAGLGEAGIGFPCPWSHGIYELFLCRY